MKKNVLQPYQLVTLGDMSGDITSNSTTIDYLDNVGVELSWSGTSPVGTLYIQASISGTTWENLNLGYAMPVASNTGHYLINLNQLPYKKIRVFYDFTSGVGSLNAYIMAKGL